MPDIANTECFEAWNGDSGRRWAAEADRRDRVLAPVGEALLRAANLQFGADVLDIGCGCGSTTLAAARTVGLEGSVRGIDLSAPMLDIARQRRDGAGLANVEFVQADAQTHSFAPAVDVAISRFGSMFFADPVAAFANIAGGLRQHGRLCLATWQPLAANDWLTVPGGALLRYGTIPENVTGGPGMFGQSNSDAVTTTLTAAGYRNVTLTSEIVTFALGATVNEATDYLASTGVARAVLETVPAEQRAAAIDAVRAVLAEYVNEGSVQLDGAIWIIDAQRG